jgi:heme/copper-type cytochrome/quinol oxidase subunit 2
MSFSNNKADVLIHLTQWQYWWWFWFAFLWALYYLLVARVFRYRTLKFNPRIASTLRPHGKWGDLLTCIIPVTWCLNILINSNFILKLIEWQSESSLFTLRVRAKQWYWIYKLDLRNIADIFSTPRNVGRNKWQFSTFGDLQTAEDYLHIMQMRAYNSWAKDFWVELTKKSVKKDRFNISTPVDVYKSEFVKNVNLTLYNNILDKKNVLNNDFGVNNNSTLISDYILTNFPLNYNNEYLFTNTNDVITLNLKESKKNILNVSKTISLKKDLLFEWNSENILDQNFFKKAKLNNPTKELNKVSRIVEFSDLELTNSFDSLSVSTFNNFFEHEILNNYNCNNVIQHPDLDDENRFVKRSAGKSTPLRVLKCPNTDIFLKDSLIQSTDIELLRFRFNEQSATISNKPIKPTVYLTFKQKRYNQKNSISQKSQMFFDKDLKTSQKYSGNPFLKEASIIEENFGNPTRQYRLVKKAKARVDTTRVANWNRLLRSRRVLVLPAHINITVITNSFDVVHSWHIPGLGLKMDCLPGRATHHTMYIDNVGLYYGQCAEICGRYHHHMPIRVCALPFEHFLVWWHTFGLPKFLFHSGPNDVNIPVNKYFTRRFSW